MVLGTDQAHETHGNPESLKRELGLPASPGGSKGKFSVAEGMQVLLKGVTGKGEVLTAGKLNFLCPSRS